jgi:aminopeptidase N
VVRTHLDHPMQWIAVAAGKYKVFAAAEDGLKCNVATYVFGKEKPAKVLQDLFFSAADTYGQFFGVPYPFEEVDVVEINSWGFGQAPPGFIFITQEAYNPIGDTISRIFSQGVNGRYVHEVAHAWWGHVVKSGSDEEEWLNESFADYSAALALQAMMGDKKGDREFKSTLREWKSRASEVAGGGSVYLANYLAGEDEADYRDRINLLYNKGPLVLHALRQELGRRLGSSEQGDRYFQALLRTLLSNFKFKLGATRDLVGILNQMTRSDWQPWFEKYVYGTETPEVEM